MKLLKGLFNQDIKANEDGTFDFIGSDSSVDRDGEIIEVKGWDVKQFNRNPVILFAHNHRIPAIARAKKAVVENGKLMIKGIKFPTSGIHALADTVKGLMIDKIMTAGSVGFTATDREFVHRDERTGLKPKASIITHKAELHEFSMVNVGSNRNALRVKGFLGEDDELNEDEILKKFPKDIDLSKLEQSMFIEKDPATEPEPAKTIEDLVKLMEGFNEKISGLEESNENIIKTLKEGKETKTIYDAILDGEPENQDHEDPPQKGSLGALFKTKKGPTKKLGDLFKK